MMGVHWIMFVDPITSEASIVKKKKLLLEDRCLTAINSVMGLHT